MRVAPVAICLAESLWVELEGIRIEVRKVMKSEDVDIDHGTFGYDEVINLRVLSRKTLNGWDWTGETKCLLDALCDVGQVSKVTV